MSLPEPHSSYSVASCPVVRQCEVCAGMRVGQIHVPYMIAVLDRGLLSVGNVLRLRSCTPVQSKLLLSVCCICCLDRRNLLSCGVPLAAMLDTRGCTAAAEGCRSGEAVKEGRVRSVFFQGC